LGSSDEFSSDSPAEAGTIDTQTQCSITHTIDITAAVNSQTTSDE